MRKTALLLLTLLGLGMMVWAEGPTGFKGTKTVVLTEQTKVGAQVLPAGEYKVAHVMEGSEHVLIFKKGKQEYRAKCNMEPLNEKATADQIWFDSEGGQRLMQAMVFRGDTVRHVIAQ